MSLQKKTQEKVEQILAGIRISASGLKLRLDRKTTVTLKSEEEVYKWLELYPNAQIIS